MKSIIYITLLALCVMACKEDDLIDGTVDLTDFAITIEENPTPGQVLGSIEKEVTGGAVDFEITSQSPEGAFALDIATGSLTVADATLFDFETNPTLTAVISGTIGEVSDEATVTVTLLDVEAVVTAEDFTLTTDENGEADAVLGTIDATGDEGALGYAISSQSQTGALAIDAVTGQLTIGDPAMFDYELTTELTAVVQVTSGTSSATANVSITLNNVLFDQASVSGTQFSARQLHQAVVFDDKLWVIGGGDEDNLYDEVWYSTDGVAWQQKTIVGTHFSARNQHQVVVFDGKLWVIGGSDDDGAQDDVWSSTDGATWTQVLASTSNALVAGRTQAKSFRFSKRSNHQVVVFDDAMWLIGGESNGNYLNDIYSSTDGISWFGKAPGSAVRSESVVTVFSERTEHELVVFDDEMWLVGGYDDNGDYLDDIWSSPDGTTWAQKTAVGTHFTGRAGHRMLSFDDKLWLIGGREGSTDQNDVWHSTDGTTWVKEGNITGAHFSTRYRHEAVVFNDNIWVIAGYSMSASDYKNDIWTKD
ncbi:hypothetical protein N7E81_02460 [Reichenbachiella carrageenanivorans]|uniref:Cadherin domain-containing protein n=1 Tax=Reichenbachiella carrageenanivorans TaxID=2979869 RepID=A0ABY6D1C3_9BACT|nr:hypothetical protein [Reichenbachiella carrageenanivorans]UXX79967.1 hypothetical protein N7E81_02460 [Reichenbachiella carrageenanivorans]